MQYIKEQYQMCFRFLKEIKKLILFCAIFFIAVGIIGYFTIANNPEVLEEVMGMIQSMFTSKDLIDASGNISCMKLTLSNLSACLLTIGLGLVPLLYLPLLVLFSNGYIMGVVGAFSMNAGMTLGSFLMGIIPHGIFELPAFFICASMGLYLCMHITAKFFRRSNASLKVIIHNMVLTYVYVAIPMLILAGMIETYITPLFM